MKRKRDTLITSPHWHVDCRIEADLPEDNVIGTRFLINAGFGALAFGMLLFAGWMGYLSLNLRYQIHDWEQRIKENRAEMLDIQRAQREYAAESAKIDQAFALVRPQFYVTGLISDLGRTRPESVTLDFVEWNESGVIVRGSLKENAERASRLLGSYVEVLRHDDKIGPLFREIVLTDLDRGTKGEALRFEISMRLKPPAKS
jgi:hypothetical protein